MSNISFIHSEFLWGIIALAIPFIVHFINRKRIVKIKFSSLRFFSISAVKAGKRRKLKKILLLVTRLFILIVLIMIFLGIINSNNPFALLKESESNIFCWIDPTVSMSYKKDGMPFSSHAKKLVYKLKKERDNKSKFLLFNHTLLSFENFKKDGNNDCYLLRHGASDFKDMIAELKENITKHKTPFTLVIFSDFQKNEIDEINNFLSLDSIFYPILFVKMSSNNDSIINYGVKIKSAIEGTPLFLNCEISANDKKMDNIDVSVEVNGFRCGDIIANCFSNTSIDTEILVNGNVADIGGFVKLNIDDNFILDNKDFFAPIKKQKISTLVICDEKNDFSVKALFQSLSNDTHNTPVVVNKNNVKFDNIDTSQIIVLCASSLSDRIINMLTNETLSDKKLIIYSPSFCTVGESLNTKITRYLGMKSEIVYSEFPLNIVFPDTISRLWHGFPKLTDENVKIHKYYDNLPGTVLLCLTNHKPFVSLKKDTLGNSWILFSAPLSIDTSNNIYESGLYLPMMDRLVSYGLHTIKKEHKYWIAGHVYRNTFFGTNKFADIYDNSGKIIDRWQSQPNVVFNKPGLYKVVASDKSVSWAVAKIDSLECRFVYEYPKIDKSISNKVKIIESKDFVRFISSRKNGFITRYLWIVLGILLITEVFLWENKEC